MRLRQDSIMVEDLFAALGTFGEKMDKGTDELLNTWRSPALMIGGYGADIEDARSEIEIFKESIAELQNSIAADQVRSSIDISQSEDLLKQSRDVYERLAEQCDELETVFAEYGYVGPEFNSPVDINRSECNDSNDFDSLQLDEVEFTPDLKWHTKRSFDNHASLQTGDSMPMGHIVTPSSNIQRSIATPVIKSLASALESHSLSCDRTPGFTRNKPKSPVYSSHFYDIINEK